MAMKRVTTQKAVNEKTYDKLKRDLEILPPGHPERGRIMAELHAAKGRVAARRGGGT